MGIPTPYKQYISISGAYGSLKQILQNVLSFMDCGRKTEVMKWKVEKGVRLFSWGQGLKEVV